MMTSFLSYFGDAPAACAHSFLGLISWFQYLPLRPAPDCSLNLPLTTTSNWPELWLVAIALVDDMLRIAGFLALILVIWGAIKLIISQGVPQNIKTARETIMNSLIGLVIAIIATGFVNYVANTLSQSQTGTSSGLPEIVADSSLVGNILNVLFGIIGVISLLMIVISGFKYVTSRGEPQETASAKNTLLYALIGLAVAIFAFTIVNFIIVKVSS